MCKKIFIPLILFALWLPACQRSSVSGFGPKDQNKIFNAEAPVSPNDLAFLFPLSEEGRPQPFVSLGSHPEIPGAQNFERIVSEARSRGVFFSEDPLGPLNDPFNWAMVSFRYSPCIFFVGTEGPCKEQLRFVFQPMNQDPNANGAFLDYSLHVAYEYAAGDKATPSELMGAVYKLRESAEGMTDNVPLSVHPVLQDQTTRLKYFNDILNTVWKPFVFDRDPTATTFMGLGTADGGGVNLGEWHFMFGLIDEFGVWNIQSLPDGSGLDVEILNVDPDSGNLTSNVTNNRQFNILTGAPVMASAAAGTLLPHSTNEHNVNCASCHVVDNQLLRERGGSPARIDDRNFDRDQFRLAIINTIGEEEEGFANNLVSNQFKGGMFSAANGTPQDGPVPPEEEVVTRMFGYMHSQPVISQRMAFDNGMAVNSMNQAILSSEAIKSQSTRSCNEFNQANAVMMCLFDNGNLSTSLEECLAQACQ